MVERLTFGEMSNGERVVEANGVELCVETFGDAADPTILLIHGASASMLWWEDELCERIAAGRRYVIRFDNRDTGRSVSYPPGQPEYSLRDLVDDAVGILDALDIDRAHFVGRSMAGGIAAMAALHHPDRVASLTLVTTTTGAADLPPPSAEFSSSVSAAEPDPSDPRAVVDYVVEMTKVYSGGSPHYDERAMRELVERDVARTRNIASCLTNHYVIDTSDENGRSLREIAVPTLVVHGEVDPVFPLAHGHALRDAIPGAELLILEQTGHDVPPPVWDEFVAALLRHTQR
jgi:pimeloyl-ACP methyl ester carboxylesterase